MAVYESEQEQLESIKKWWKENGASIVMGLVLGLALLFGWRGWQGYISTRAELASGLYEQVLRNLEQNKAELARQVAAPLLSEYAGSPYSVLAQLNLAAQDLKEGNTNSCHARLQWVIDRNTLPEVTHLARMRKIKLWLSETKLDEAKKLLASVTDKGRFIAAYTELSGDIALLQNQRLTARTAYEEALKLGDELFSSEEKSLVQMKLDNLGAKKVGMVEANLPVALPAETKTAVDASSSTNTESVTPAKEAVKPSESAPKTVSTETEAVTKPTDSTTVPKIEETATTTTETPDSSNPSAKSIAPINTEVTPPTINTESTIAPSEPKIEVDTTSSITTEVQPTSPPTVAPVTTEEPPVTEVTMPTAVAPESAQMPNPATITPPPAMAPPGFEQPATVMPAPAEVGQPSPPVMMPNQPDSTGSMPPMSSVPPQPQGMPNVTWQQPPAPNQPFAASPVMPNPNWQTNQPAPQSPSMTPNAPWPTMPGQPYSVPAGQPSYPPNAPWPSSMPNQPYSMPAEQPSYPPNTPWPTMPGQPYSMPYGQPPYPPNTPGGQPYSQNPYGYAPPAAPAQPNQYQSNQ